MNATRLFRRPPARPTSPQVGGVATSTATATATSTCGSRAVAGANIDSHLMVNNGDGTFAVDSSSNHQRLEAESRPPLNAYGRFHIGHFADLDHDGDSDLVLGQLRHRSCPEDPSAVEAWLTLERSTGRLIQQELRNEGIDPGTPDGLFGPRCRAG